MENKFFSGQWTGVFIKTESNKTQVILTEKLYIKNFFIEILSIYEFKENAANIYERFV